MTDRPEQSKHIKCIGETCLEHSGIMSRMNIGIALLSVLCALFGYSSFVQLPAVEDRIVCRIVAIEKSLDSAKRDIQTLQLEDVRIKAQRNADHPKKDPLQ